MSTTIEINQEALLALSISDLQVAIDRLERHFDGASYRQSVKAQDILSEELDNRINNIFTF